MIAPESPFAFQDLIPCGMKLIAKVVDAYKSAMQKKH